MLVIIISVAHGPTSLLRARDFGRSLLLLLLLLLFCFLLLFVKKSSFSLKQLQGGQSRDTHVVISHDIV